MTTRKVLIGFSGAGVAKHECLPAPLIGRSLCGVRLGALIDGIASDVTCYRCLVIQKRQDASTEHDRG